MICAECEGAIDELEGEYVIIDDGALCRKCWQARKETSITPKDAERRD
jgi:hypothetical protein